MFLNPYVYIDNNDDLKIMNIFCRIIIYLREREILINSIIISFLLNVYKHIVENNNNIIIQ